ncbi:MAG: ATP-binding protein [Candidatus Korarchaeota archaeon]|nr:ATP-binding protein [Candidatus Korarchaeota archaeon]
MLEIERREVSLLRASRGWILVYGRRKVGKTFVIKRYLDWDVYVTVSRARDAIVEDFTGVRRAELDAALERVSRVLSSGGAAVVDEFQRLPEGAWDLLAALHPQGRLIASGSSLGIVGRVFDRRSPLLGLIQPFMMDVIRYADAVASLSRHVEARASLEWGILLRDPWISPMVDPRSEGDPVRWLCDSAPQLVMSAQGLVGEVFTEEERNLTALYESVMRLLAEGVWRPSEIAGILSSRGLLEGGTPAVTGILARLSSMGLVEGIPLWRSGRARVYYRHRSPLLSLLLYLEQKFGVSDGYAPEYGPVRSAFGREAEYSVGEMLAERLRGRMAHHVSERRDVDVVVLDARERRVLAAYEVKLGGFTRSEAREAVERMRGLGPPRVGLVSLRDEPPAVEGADELLGPEELVEVARQLHESASESGTRG